MQEKFQVDYSLFKQTQLWVDDFKDSKSKSSSKKQKFLGKTHNTINSHIIAQSNFNALQRIFQEDTLLFDNFNEYSQIQRHESDQFTFENHDIPKILTNAKFNQAIPGSEPEFLDGDLQTTSL
jgi:hypothetical protein